MLVLTQTDVDHLYSGPEALRDAMEAIRQVHLDLADGRAVERVRVHVDHPPGVGYQHFARILPAVHPSAQVCNTRIYTVARDWRGPTAKERDLYVLWRLEDGGFLAVIASDRVGSIRTAAPTALATDLLARPDATEVAVIGSGVHARAQLAAVCTVRRIRAVRVYSPTPEHRERFAAEMSEALQVPVTSAATPQEAIRDADIVTAATGYPRNMALHGEWIEPGTHVNSIGATREVDETMVRRSRLVVSTRDQVVEHDPPLEPVHSMLQDGRLSEEEVSLELSDVLVGRKPGRQGPEQITLFLSAGCGLWDAAIAARVYQRAREQGIGLDVDLS